jgi:hypothetical protein
LTFSAISPVFACSVSEDCGPENLDITTSATMMTVKAVKINFIRSFTGDCIGAVARSTGAGAGVEGIAVGTTAKALPQLAQYLLPSLFGAPQEEQNISRPPNSHQYMLSMEPEPPELEQLSQWRPEAQMMLGLSTVG